MKLGCRKWVVNAAFDISIRYFFLVMGMKITKKQIDFDYSYYLGPNYKKEMNNDRKTSTIVCNHVSWMDATVLIRTLAPAFAPSEEFR